MRKIKDIAVLANRKKPNALKEVMKLHRWLKRHRCNIYFSEELSAILNQPDERLPISQMPKKTQLAIVLGGDGTLLWGARVGAYGNNPVLGVNLGSLGFLVGVSTKELYPTLEKILKGNYSTDKRMMLEVQVLRKSNKFSTLWKQIALNDVVISKETIARMVRLRITINGKIVNEYHADGLIVSSPTGSTAHSLSAGGPIVHPHLDALILTPICPHTLSNRPLIVDGSDELKIEIITPNQNTYLTVDGQEGSSLHNGDIIRIRRAKDTIHLITSPTRDYYQVLHTKLHWGRR